MAESWRVRIGTPMMETSANIPRRRNQTAFSDHDSLDPEDFSDVFGGPPRSVFWRKNPGEFSGAGGHSKNNNNSSFYEEIFRQQEIHSDFAGRGLPAFRIPGERFYSDVFGSSEFPGGGEDRRWKAKSMSTSSSVLSSEEMSPLRPIANGGDHHVAFSDFASKLRPINVPSRRRNSQSRHANYNNDIFISSKKNNNYIPSFYTNRPSFADQSHQFVAETDHHNHNRNHHHHNTSNWNFGVIPQSGFGFSRRVSSPETISLGPDSYPSVKISVDDVDLDLESPSSAVSSVGDRNADDVAKSSEQPRREEGLVDDDNDEDSSDEDEIMSSYVIEIGSGSDRREETSCDAVGIDDAIAWAKERSQMSNSASEKDLNNSTQNHDVKDDQSSKMDEDSSMENNKHGNEMVQSSPEMEIMRIQDENIRLWSVGKEADIRLLLSTLHYILWNNSGWSAITLTSIIDSSQVKKAYQKARLCLHPDKLQQRGATLPQKYIADKAFSILQDAWATFISQETVLHRL